MPMRFIHVHEFFMFVLEEARLEWFCHKKLSLNKEFFLPVFQILKISWFFWLNLGPLLCLTRFTSFNLELWRLAASFRFSAVQFTFHGSWKQANGLAVVTYICKPQKASIVKMFTWGKVLQSVDIGFEFVTGTQAL
jgi:hypothetical protein